MVFIDLTEAFDTVNQHALWIILSQMGCSPKLVRIIMSFHNGMCAKVMDDGKSSESSLYLVE